MEALRQTAVLSEINQVQKSPLYYAPQHIYCKCAYFVCIDRIVVEDFSIIVHCINDNCKENSIQKKISMPVITEYQILN